MSNTLTLTDEQYQALQSGKSITIQPPEQITEQWEPKGGEWNVSLTSEPYETSVRNIRFRLAGLEYETEQQAIEASKVMRSYARQLKWLAENDDGWVADWNDHSIEKYLVYYNNRDSKYCTTWNNAYKEIGINYMSKENANKLCKLLNEGIVIL